MSVFKRGGVCWYEFQFAGQRVRESAKTTSTALARQAERARRRELEQGFNGIERAQRAQMFSVVAENWHKAELVHWSPRTAQIERANLNHLLPFFGKLLLCDIKADDVSRYQGERLKKRASPKTVNLEVGTLRAILRKNRVWAAIQPDVRMLRAREDVGRAISPEEEAALLQACGESRSRSLHPAVVLALNTCLRYSELRLLRWGQVDVAGRTLTVGQSKTEAGAGRVIPLNDRAYAVLSFWTGLFPDRKPEHYVFPSERYGAAGDDFSPCAWGTDPSKPIGRWKEAWEAAKHRAGAILKGDPKDETAEPLRCRFHDLRHTGCTRMLEGGVPFSIVATVMGWSASTTVRMAKRYGHIGQAAQRQAVAVLAGAKFEGQYPQKSPHSQTQTEAARAN